MHTIYGIYFCGTLIYIGCTGDFKQRSMYLLCHFKELKRNRSLVEIREIATAPNKREGNRLETRLIGNELRGGNSFICNANPSMTLTAFEHDRKFWVSHWLSVGHYPCQAISKRGGRNWTNIKMRRSVKQLKAMRILTGENK